MKLGGKKVNILEEVKAGGQTFKNLHIGNYRKNKPHGFGIQYFYPDLYIGNFSFGKKNSYGILKCKKGYKYNGKSKFFYMDEGIYIGIFKNNKFYKGKVIHFDRIKKEKYVYFIDNYKLNGPYRIYHKNYNFTFHYVNEELIGDYVYNGIYTVYSKLLYGEFHGTSIILTKDGCMHQLFYKNGDVVGKSIYMLPNKTYFLLSWIKNVCYEIVYIKNRRNKLFYPQRIFDNLEICIPIEYQCPIGYTLMIQPYINNYKQTYEFKNLKLWIHNTKLRKGKIRDPLTNKICDIDDYKPNIDIQYKIFNFIEKSLLSSKIFYLK